MLNTCTCIYVCKDSQVSYHTLPLLPATHSLSQIPLLPPVDISLIDSCTIWTNKYHYSSVIPTQVPTETLPEGDAIPLPLTSPWLSDPVNAWISGGISVWWQGTDVGEVTLGPDDPGHYVLVCVIKLGLTQFHLLTKPSVITPWRHWWGTLCIEFLLEWGTACIIISLTSFLSHS